MRHFNFFQVISRPIALKPSLLQRSWGGWRAQRDGWGLAAGRGPEGTRCWSSGARRRIAPRRESPPGPAGHPPQLRWRRERLSAIGLPMTCERLK